MRGFQALVILGGLLVVVGIFLVLPPVPFTSSHTANIPSGDYYYYITLDVRKGGHISGTFSELSSNVVVLYVFSSAQFNAYRNGGPALDSMFQTSGTTGTFSASVPLPGTYYIVLQHGASTFSQAQNVQVSYTINGMNLVYLGLGLGVLAVGFLLATLGYTRNRRATPPRKVTDVIMFNQPKQESGQTGQLGLTMPPPFVQQPRTKGRLDCPVCGLYFTPELAGSGEWAKIHFREHMTRIHPDYVKLHGRWNYVLAGIVVVTIILSIALLVDPQRYVDELALAVVMLVVVIALRSMSLGGRRRAWYRRVTTPLGETNP